MWLKRFLVVLGIACIPLWYVYRTATEKRVLRLDRTIFMSEEERQERAAAMKREAEEVKRKAEYEWEFQERLEADQRRQKEAKKRAAEQCMYAVEMAEKAYSSYNGERLTYSGFIGSLQLRKPEEFRSDLSRIQFVAALATLERELWANSVVDSHRQKIAEAGRGCESAAAREESGWDHIQAADKERVFFTNGRDALARSRREIELITKYVDDKFPDNIGGQLERMRAESLFYRR